MKKENIVNLVPYTHDKHEANSASTVSTELENAIQNLIYRLRELGPLQSSH